LYHPCKLAHSVKKVKKILVVILLLKQRKKYLGLLE